jgi:hypothetical protein
LAVTLLKVYELTAPTVAPSTVTLLILYPLLGLIVKLLLAPALTLTEPDGEMDPPEPAVAVMV